MSTVPSQLRSLLRVIRSCPYSRSMLVGPIMATILGLGVMPHLRGQTPPLADCPESVYDPYAQKMCCLSVVTVVYLRAMPLPLPRHSEVSRSYRHCLYNCGCVLLTPHPSPVTRQCRWWCWCLAHTLLSESPSSKKEMG
jgi:hypothetical protein